MRLLLDGHIASAVAQQLRSAGHDVVTLADWLGGNYRTSADEHILVAAAADRRMLVTFDLKTIPALLKEWAETGQSHAGVILVDERTMRQNDIGGLTRALLSLAVKDAPGYWQDRVEYLKPSTDS